MKAARSLCLGTIVALLGCSASIAQVSNLKRPVQSQALVWSDEFNGPAQSQPDPANWTYDVGASGWGNKELETYCAWASKLAPCSDAAPNAFVGSDGYLHLLARKPHTGGTLQPASRPRP